MARKRRRRDEELDEDDDFDGDAPVTARKAKLPGPDAYVGLLAITFVALATAAGLLYFDHESLSAQNVQAPTVTVPDLGGGKPAGT